MKCDKAPASLRLLPFCSLSFDQKLPFTHDLLFALSVAEPDIELQSDYIDVRRGLPRRARVRSVGIAERDVNAGKLFVLQNISDHARDADVRADGKLAHAV